MDKLTISILNRQPKFEFVEQYEEDSTANAEKLFLFLYTGGISASTWLKCLELFQNDKDNRVISDEIAEKYGVRFNG